MTSKHKAQPRPAPSLWLSPECFPAILDGQSLEGGFGLDRTQVGSILTTTAALLSLLKHRKNPNVYGHPGFKHVDLSNRINYAREYLHETLQTWDVGASNHVGFEILVPNLLEMLQRRGVNNDFPGYNTAMAMNEQNMVKYEIEGLYIDCKTTPLHSLEAFLLGLSTLTVFRITWSMVQ